MIKDPEKLRTVLVTDCGSTTTKALLFKKGETRWELVTRGEAPTTVEDPVADVTVGAINAFKEIEELSKRTILDLNQKIPFEITNGDAARGIDLYLSTSSAGGGLQMLVAGIVSSVSASSAARAALGAGAIVLDNISFDNILEDYEVIKKIRDLKPDIFLLTGGLDQGASSQVLELAELILAAAPKPRFGQTLTLPVIYAGNPEVSDQITTILKPIADVTTVDNVRPTYEKENLAPARVAIHDLFLQHVMSHSPGYDKLLTWSPQSVLPTPTAVGNIVNKYAENTQQNVIAVDIGGATTDIFSAFEYNDQFNFNRTVSANLGMSYSIANVLLESGIENLMHWLSDDFTEEEVKDRLRNKMLRPTSIPQTKKDLALEQAVCREALRLSLAHHKSLAKGVDSQERQKGIANIFSQKNLNVDLVDMKALDLVIGSGGVLSHAPERLQAAQMLLDGFNLLGFTHITVDSIFMLPHLGILSEVHEQAAEEIFLNDCLVNVAHAIVPIYDPKKCKIYELAKIEVNSNLAPEIRKGILHVHPLKTGEEYKLKVIPLDKKIDVGAGPGAPLEKNIIAGECGLILDGRGRTVC